MQTNGFDRLKSKIQVQFPDKYVRYDGPLDMNFKDIESGLNDIYSIIEELKEKNMRRLENSDITIHLEQSKDVNISIGTFDPYRFAYENKFLLLKKMSQFSIHSPFIRICVFSNDLSPVPWSGLVDLLPISGLIYRQAPNNKY